MSVKKPSGKPILDSAGRAMWAKVARTVDPLHGRHIFAEPDQPSPAIAVPNLAPRKSVPSPAPRAAKPAPPPSATLDGTWERKINRGRIEPDRTIDLHGLTLDQAWRRIDFAMEDAVASGARTLLVVTGKAVRDASSARASSDDRRPRGMIRAKLEDWLAASRHASAIASIRGAHPRHGGSGAVYVILRRRRA